jgi:arylsulfatase A-like enzyme/Flp pilus assembly protein TadD
MTLLALSGVAAGCGASGRPGAHPSVLLVTLDTTRADHVGAYGALPSVTPVFDRIGGEGALFTRAWTVTPLTTPAHTSLMTGLYPQAHGVRNNGRMRMSDAVTTLAEALSASGYRTGAFVGALPVSRAFGFAQGFATFDDDFGEGGKGQARTERTAAEVNARALPWLRTAVASRQPFFAWIHYYDAHAPYEPPSPFAERFPDRLYDGEIAFVDSEFGRVVELLRRSGALDRTIVVAVADHGEGLGDHGELAHGFLLYEPMIHVPLAIRAPWAIPAGTKRKDLASVVDVAPTIAALAKVSFPDDVDGRNLLASPSTLPESDDPENPGPGRAVYAETFFAAEEFQWAPIVSVRRGDMKWIAVPRPERYDLAADPGEETNLAGREPSRDAAMQALLARVAAASSARGKGRTSDAHVDDDLVARLQSLGYIGGGAGAPASGAAAVGRDPKDALADYVEYRRGTDLLVRGGDAADIFERLVASDPGNPEFRMRLGQAYRARGDLAAAEAAYRELLRRFPDYYLATRRLAALLSAQGRNEEARDLWLALKARGGAFVGLDKRLAEAYLGTRENDSALAAAERGLAQAPDAELDVLAGRALERLGRDAEALERYRAALAARASYTEALDGAIALLRRLGRTGEIRPMVEDCVARSAGNAAVKERLTGL